MSDISFREAASNSVRFWERGRVVYNFALLLIVVGYFVAGLPDSLQQLSLNLALGLFILAVLANVAYCAAYPIDVFVQYTTFRDLWSRARWGVLAVGTLFAAAVTRFFAMGMFVNGPWYARADRPSTGASAARAASRRSSP